MQIGVGMWETAGFLGMSKKTVRDVYGHHHPDSLQGAAKAIGTRKPISLDITLRRRDDAGDALRSGPDYAGAFRKMVVAQGLGDEDRQAPRDEKGNRGLSASVGRDHAPHMG
jgi:hypothetical protein